VARRRARTAMAILVSAIGILTIGTVVLIRLGGPGFRGLAWAIFVGAMLPLVAPVLCMESSRGELITGHGAHHCLLTARTITGLRTVDLSKLRSIRRYVMPGRFGYSLDLLVIKDRCGVRIGLTSIESRIFVRQALRPPGGKPPLSAPKVTRWAARDLRGDRFSVADALIPLLLGALWAGGVTALCFAVAIG